MKNTNTQDIFLRNLTISLLDLLNRQLEIELWRDDRPEIHTIPFYFNQGTDEGFMQDFFIGIPSTCKISQMAEGNYDPIPRGIITLSSFNVKSSDLVNKYVRGTFQRDEFDENDAKKSKAYSARLYSLPLKVSFDAKIIVDNLNKTFKATEKLFDLFYSNRVMYFQYRGIRIPALFVFPDQATNDKAYKFSYTDNNKITITFQIEIETYFPSFDKTTEMFRGNVIDQILTKTIDKDSGQLDSKNWIDNTES
jgi:hypothetical protein